MARDDYISRPKWWCVVNQQFTLGVFCSVRDAFGRIKVPVEHENCGYRKPTGEIIRTMDFRRR